MTLQSQLDQVLALVDQFALTGRANWTHPKREVFANELRSRLSEIRSAVGGEAVAWMLRRKRDDFVRGCYATKPTAESLEFAELDGDYYTPLYASPPATVDVGPKDLVTVWRAMVAEADNADVSLTLKHCADELAALIGEEA